MQQPGSEPLPHSAAGEILAQLSQQQHHAHPGRLLGAQHDPAQLASYLQQGAMATGMGDPAHHAHLFQMLAQLQAAPGAWGTPSGSASLETLLAQISRQPEIVASLPNLLGGLTGGLTGGLLARPTPQRAELLSELPDLHCAPPGPAQDVKPQLDGGGQGGFGVQLFTGRAAPEPEPQEEPTARAPQAEAASDPEGAHDAALHKANSAKCAKEKNRQAQRRFRERQKTLITTLKDTADRLQKEVEEQKRVIDNLEKENQVLKVILQEKSKPS